MTIEQAWEGYRKNCVPSDAGPEQLHETRMAFYAGFMTMFEVNMALADPRISERQGIEILERYRKELKRFRDRVAQEAQQKVQEN